MYNYLINVFYSEEDKGFIATVPDLKNCSGFGETEKEAIEEVKKAMEIWIKTAKEENIKIPEPTMIENNDYSGKFVVRVSKSLHKKLVENSKKEGVSLNLYINNLLAEKNAIRHSI